MKKMNKPQTVEVNKGRLEVSDWSQKYKLAIYAISGLVIGYFGWKMVSLLEQIVINTAK